LLFFIGKPQFAVGKTQFAVSSNQAKTVNEEGQTRTGTKVEMGMCCNILRGEILGKRHQ
jgi:hypothetical protein